MPKTILDTYSPDLLEAMAASLEEHAAALRAVAGDMRSNGIPSMEVKNSVGMNNAPKNVSKFLTAARDAMHAARLAAIQERTIKQTQAEVERRADALHRRRSADKKKKD